MSDEITNRPGSVYREPATMSSTSMGPTSGLLRVQPSHRCSPPGLTLRLLLRVFFRFGWLSLWRCRECGQTWQWRPPFHYTNNDSGNYCEWVKVDLDAWTEAGGTP